MSKFKFGKGEGFKMPGLGSKEINTPGSFRQEQGVEDVGYCLNTEQSMLPKGSSPLLAKDANFLIPDYYSTTYTGSPETGDTKKTIVEEGERGSSDDDGNNVVSDKIVTKDTDNPDTNEYVKRSSVTTRDKGWDDLEKEFISQGITGDALTKKMDEAKAWRKANPNVKNIGMETKNLEVSSDGGKTYRPAKSQEEYDNWGGAKRS